MSRNTLFLIVALGIVLFALGGAVFKPVTVSEPFSPGDSSSATLGEGEVDPPSPKAPDSAKATTDESADQGGLVLDDEDLFTDEPVEIEYGPDASVFRVSSTVPPYFTLAALDPKFAEPGETMTLTAQVNFERPIESVTVTLKTSGAQPEVTLERIEGTELDGTWQGNVVLPPDYGALFGADFSAVSGDDVSLVGLRFQ